MSTPESPPIFTPPPDATASIPVTASVPLTEDWKRPNFFQRKDLPLWVSLFLALVLLLLGAVIGAVMGSSGKVDEAKLKAANSEIFEKTADFNSRRGQLQSQVTEYKAQADSADERAKADAEASLKPRIAELDQRKADLDTRQGQLDSRSAELDQREQAVGQAEARIEASSFGDGLFEVGTDIQRGKYRTDGQSDCYWAKLGSSDTSDYIDNSFAGGPQTVVIDSSYFQSQDCGTWNKVG